MQPIKRVLTSKIFLFCLLLAVIWLALVSVRAWYRRYQLDQQIAALKNEISKMEKSDGELSQLIKYFNNQDFLEKEAKDKLNLKNAGENVMMVSEAAIGQELSAQQAASMNQPAAPQPPAEENNFIKWWKYLFGR